MEAARQPTRQHATKGETARCDDCVRFHSPPTTNGVTARGAESTGQQRRRTTSQPASNQRRDRPRRKNSRRKDPATVAANQRPSDHPTRPPPTASPPAVPSWRAPGTSADRVDMIGEKGEEGRHATIGGERDTRLEGDRDAKQLADGISSWLALHFSAVGCLSQ